MSLAARCRFPRSSTATDLSKCQISYHLITCITWNSLLTAFIKRPIETYTPSLRAEHPANLNPERDARNHDVIK
jgi:hypothetical protein